MRGILVRNTFFPKNFNIHRTGVEKLDIIPSNIDLAGAEVELVSEQNREKVLKTYGIYKLFH